MKTTIEIDGEQVFEGDKPKMKANETIFFQGEWYRVRRSSTFTQNRQESQEVEIVKAR